MTALYSTHYRSLVRLAALLLRDVSTAEEVVQDSFVAMHGGWRRLRDSEKALSYLRQSVVNRSRSVLRHRMVVDRNMPKPAPDMPSAEQGAIAQLERSAVVTALRSLPARQREALVLRYYGDLSEAQIAATMGISQGAVKSHTARAMSALRACWSETYDSYDKTKTNDKSLGGNGRPGAESMTHPSLEYEDRLRRALRAAADSVEPSADGLGRIRARLTPPRPVDGRLDGLRDGACPCSACGPC